MDPIKLMILLALMEMIDEDDDEATDDEEHDCSTCDAAEGCPIKDIKLEREREEAFAEQLKKM